jgi:hypothetical protein
MIMGLPLTPWINDAKANYDYEPLMEISPWQAQDRDASYAV